MPFDGVFDLTPLEIRLLDRTKELIATSDVWVQKHFSQTDYNNKTRRCLYGALFVAERELAKELPVYINDPATFIAIAKKKHRNTAFYRVHRALNIEARPLLCYFSRDQNFAIKYNDAALSLFRVHGLINRARTRLFRQLATAG